MSVHGIREGLVAELLQSKKGRALKQHIKERASNHGWIAEMRGAATPEEAASFFPYCPQSKGSAVITEERIVPNAGFTAEPQGTRRKPCFLINIPVAHLPLDTSQEKIDTLVRRLRDEGFGENAKNSRAQAGKKLAIVLGINQIESIDSEVNRSFRSYVAGLSTISGIAYRVVGFFWKPEWTKIDLKKIPGIKEKPKLAKRLFSCTKAFLVFKCLNPVEARRVLQKLEGSVSTGLSASLKTQIPFQRIRQAIKEADATRFFARKFNAMTGKAPVYYVTMDADCKKLRTTKNGYFSRYEEIIDQTHADHGFFPSIISLGYRLNEDAWAIPRFAVKCDMAVRCAMNTLPGSIYFPEPGTGYNLTAGGNLLKNLKAFSFLARRSGADAGLESRRAIENGVRAGILNVERSVFDPKGALETSMPERMKSKTVEKYHTLRPSDFKKKGVLKALRGVSQVHFNPPDWAHNLCDRLPEDFKKGAGAFRKVSGILTQVYAVFDPIGLVFNYADTYVGPFSSLFDEIFDIYETYAKAILAGERENHVEKVRGKLQLRIDDSFEDLETVEDFVQGRFALLQDAKKRLEAEANFSDEWITKVVDVAHASGAALFKVLNKKING